MSKLNQINIQGFKSIQQLENFELSSLNVLIGGNGAGKSNFIDVFRMLRAMMNSGLGGFAMQRGGADGFFFGGPKQTPEIKLGFDFGNNEYRLTLKTTADEKFLIEQEEQKYKEGGSWKEIAYQAFESALPEAKEQAGVMGSRRGVGYYVHKAIASWVVYHFHDTSPTAPMRRYEIVEHCEKLAPDAGNIAPFLLNLKSTPRYQQTYQRIVETIRLAIPFFDDFLLTPRFMGEEEKVRLSWRQKGTDYPMQPYHLSDGSLRFICLVTALLQPTTMLPSTILIDEPELGLHPYAIEVLADILQEVSEKTQLIISTQSPALVDNFEPENVVVVGRKNNNSTFKRLNKEHLASWLEDYSLGELWQKNVIAGAPSYEF